MKIQKFSSIVIIFVALFCLSSMTNAEPYDKEELKPTINGQLIFPKLNLENPEKCRDSVDFGAMKNSQRAICDKIELNLLDRILNSRYQSLRKKLDTEQKQTLTNGQKAWLKFREEWCRFEKIGPLEGPMGEARYTSCLLEMTSKQISRIKELTELN